MINWLISQSTNCFCHSLFYIKLLHFDKSPFHVEDPEKDETLYWCIAACILEKRGDILLCQCGVGVQWWIVTEPIATFSHGNQEGLRGHCVSSCEVNLSSTEDMLHLQWNLLGAVFSWLCLRASSRCHSITKQIIHLDRKEWFLEKGTDCTFCNRAAHCIQCKYIVCLSVVSHSCSRSCDFQINGAQPGFYCTSLCVLQDPWPLSVTGQGITCTKWRQREKEGLCDLSWCALMWRGMCAYTYL